MTGGTVVMTNFASNIGQSGIAVMTVSGGTVLAGQLALAKNPGSVATLTVAGGTLITPGLTSTGTVFGATNAVWVTGGQLTVTNTGLTIGTNSLTRLVISNGVMNTASLTVRPSPSAGTVTVAGGVLNVLSQLDLRGTGVAVWVTGGTLLQTNNNTFLGVMVISNGLFVSRDVFINNTIGLAALTVAGGAVEMKGGGNGLFVSGSGSTGMIWQTGGRIVVTNTTLLFHDHGLMTASNGTLVTSNVFLSSTGGDGRSTFNIAGSTNHVYASLLLGDEFCSGTGIVNMTSGQLFVTNGAGNATLDVRSGTLTISGGLLVADKIVITNPCAHFVSSGGAIFYNTAILPPNGDADGDGIPNGYELSHGLNALDPANANQDSDGDGLTDLQEYLAGTDPTDSASAFRITSVVRTNNNIRITWATAGGHTNRVLVATPVPGGGFTNEFNNLSPFIIIPGSGDASTNYTHVGGATNSPSNFYRIRLIP